MARSDQRHGTLGPTRHRGRVDHPLPGPDERVAVVVGGGAAAAGGGQARRDRDRPDVEPLVAGGIPPGRGGRRGSAAGAARTRTRASPIHTMPLDLVTVGRRASATPCCSGHRRTWRPTRPRGGRARSRPAPRGSSPGRAPCRGRASPGPRSANPLGSPGPVMTWAWSPCRLSATAAVIPTTNTMAAARASAQASGGSPPAGADRGTRREARSAGRDAADVGAGVDQAVPDPLIEIDHRSCSISSPARVAFQPFGQRRPGAEQRVLHRLLGRDAGYRGDGGHVVAEQVVQDHHLPLTEGQSHDRVADLGRQAGRRAVVRRRARARRATTATALASAPRRRSCERHQFSATVVVEASRESRVAPRSNALLMPGPAPPGRAPREAGSPPSR